MHVTLKAGVKAFANVLFIYDLHINVLLFVTSFAEGENKPIKT